MHPAETAAIDWNRHFHAYGVAGDTPGHLRNLVSVDTSLQAEAIEHLNGAVLHQGTVYSVTPVAVQAVLGVLADPAVRRPMGGARTALSSLLGFLGDVAGSVEFFGEVDPAPPPEEGELADLFVRLRANDEDGGHDGWGSRLIGVIMGQAVIALRGMTAEVQSALLPLLSDADVAVRMEAMNAAARWGALAPAPAAAQAGPMAAELRRQLAACTDRDERAGLVIALGQLGEDVSQWLADPDEAVRACCAMYVRSARAEVELATALGAPARIDTWFKHRPAAFSVQPRFVLLGKLLERKPLLEDMLPAALALIAHSKAFLADHEWGRILWLVFPAAADAYRPGARPPTPAPPLPTRLSAAQRAVLEALVSNEELWTTNSGNASLARKRVGLPNDRDEVIAYLSTTGRESAML